MSKSKQKKQSKVTSLKSIIKFYRHVQIPWYIIILVLIMLLAVKEIESRMVPITTKIQMGAITKNGFLGLFIVMTIVYGITEALQGGINELGGVITARNVRRSVWKKLVHLPMSSFDNEDRQSLVSRITQDTTGAYAAVTCIVQLIAVIYGIYTNFRKMLRVYKSLAYVMLSSIPITILAAIVAGWMQYKMQTITLDSFAKITGFFGERLPNINHIKVSNMEDEEYRKGIEANEARYRSEIRYWNIAIFQGPLITFAQYVNQVILLILASSLVRAGVMKMSQMLNLYNYFLQFMGNAILLTAVWQGVKQTQGSCATIARLYELEEEQLTKGQEINDCNQSFTFENVSFSYDGEVKVLDGVSFSIPAGKTTAIVGENGSGKSTIIKLLERFNESYSGTICYGSYDIKDLRLYDWRQMISHLFQDGQLVQGSIRENICYGLDREVSEQELIDACKKAKAYDFIMQKQDGFDTQISNFNNKLSGGEMQRVAIARVLLQKPDILIMDEATSGIDIVNEEEIFDAISTLMENKTIIIVSHNLETIQKADHIVVLRDGKVDGEGDLQTVENTSALFQSFKKGGN